MTLQLRLITPPAQRPHQKSKIFVDRNVHRTTYRCYNKHSEAAVSHVPDIDPMNLGLGHHISSIQIPFRKIYPYFSEAPFRELGVFNGFPKLKFVVIQW